MYIFLWTKELLRRVNSGKRLGERGGRLLNLSTSFSKLKMVIIKCFCVPGIHSLLPHSHFNNLCAQIYNLCRTVGNCVNKKRLINCRLSGFLV